VEGEGYLIESAPVSLILVTTVLFTIVSVRGIKFFYRFRRLQQSLCECQITVGERTAHWQGFLDSGNQLSFRGEPVCVISAEGIFALFGKEAKAVGRIAVTTVNSSKERPVFRCDGLTIEGKSVGAVYFTVGDVKNKTVILHTALVEGSYGTVYGTQAALTEDKGGKRRTLSLRK
jgi:hypothetical protein